MAPKVLIGNEFEGYLSEDCVFLRERTFSWPMMRGGGLPEKDSPVLKLVGVQR